MSALAPVAPWTPEDDLLLKNAVEAGASLESLAKGAAKFSRRYTVRELQDRWFSLLYDPVVSAEASAHMIEFERSSMAHPLKSNRAGFSKENKCTTGKRKSETVRNCYYALRKRICSEPFDSMDLSFIVGPPNGNYVGNGDQPLSGNRIPGDSISSPFGLEVSEMDNLAHTFPNCLMDASAASSCDMTPIRIQNPPQENFQIEKNNTHKEIPHILGENLPSIGKESAFGEMGEAKDFPMHSIFTANQVNVDQSNHEFEVNMGINSPVSGCVAPFNNLEYSPLPGMSMWKTVSTPSLPVVVDLGEKDLCSVDSFHLPDDYDAITSGYDVHSQVKVKIETDYDDFQVHNSPDGYLAELSNSLLNFTNEEELLVMNADGKDIIDKSYYDGLSSLLLNSPAGACQVQVTDMTEPAQVANITEPAQVANITEPAQVANITEPENSTSPDVCAAKSLGLCHEDNKVSNDSDEQMTCDQQIEIPPSISASNLEFPELKDGVICCMLNTEDPDIPCNDDVFLQNPPQSMSSIAEQMLQPANSHNSSSAKVFSVDQRIRDRGPSLMHKEQKVVGESYASSQRIGSSVVQEIGPIPAGCNFGIKSADSKSNLANVATRVSDISSSGLDMMNTADASTNGEVLMTRHLNLTDCSINTPALGNASFTSYPHKCSVVIKEEHDVSAATRDQDSVHAELTSMNIAVPEPVLDTPAEDQDGAPLDSDEDIPYYSDIEAMILDMDLDPDDQNLNASEEVLSYQQEDTKRAIIRLEQSARAHMLRALASHGALAILYGRHSKHYIKKPEVLLGRATSEDIVDIDLGREGRANKISRKQAIIKMDNDGSFYLKNLNSSSIFVNSKEVGYKQSIALNSNCLIEIRGMPFIFEMNQTRMKTYLDSLKDTNKTQEHISLDCDRDCE